MVKKELLSEAENQIKTIGGFLVSGNNPPNLMALTWGAFGTFWNKPVFVAPVRNSKYTRELIDSYKEFAISIPRKDFSDTIAKAVNVSGRDIKDKFDFLNLHATKCRCIDSYIVGDFGLHFECKVIYTTTMDSFHIIDQNIAREFYTDKNYHSLYFAEIVDVYETK